MCHKKVEELSVLFGLVLGSFKWNLTSERARTTQPLGDPLGVTMASFVCRGVSGIKCCWFLVYQTTNMYIERDKLRIKIKHIQGQRRLQMYAVRVETQQREREREHFFFATGNNNNKRKLPYCNKHFTTI